MMGGEGLMEIRQKNISEHRKIHEVLDNLDKKRYYLVWGIDETTEGVRKFSDIENTLFYAKTKFDLLPKQLKTLVRGEWIISETKNFGQEWLRLDRK
jgi:hypothetical protein